jgi:hypothetical protein
MGEEVTEGFARQTCEKRKSLSELHPTARSTKVAQIAIEVPWGVANGRRSCRLPYFLCMARCRGGPGLSVRGSPGVHPELEDQ